MAQHLGIDLGGTKIELLVLDEQGREQLRRRIATPRDDYPATLSAIAALVAAAEAEAGRSTTIGIGTPGAESFTDGRLRNANSTCLNGKPLRADLQGILGREVSLANDANCFALSEACDGAGQGADVVFGAILGTGVGGGIVVGQKLLTGANRIAGEWGHIPLPGEAHGFSSECYCGRRGCVETWLSGPGLANDHLRHSGDFLEARQIAARAETGDAACELSLRRYENRLARALALVINVLDPQVIVLGGGLSQIRRLYTNVPVLWRAHVFSNEITTRLLPPVHGDASGVRGAARLWQTPT